MSSYPPYAGPAGAAVISAGGRPGLRRPYVPAPWRSTPATDASVPASAAANDVMLPSIDAFLERGADDENTVLTSSPAGHDPARVEPGVGGAVVAGAVVAEPQDADDEALRGEDWAMSDAAADVVSLAAGLGAADESREAALLLPPLPMWSDDDLLDIMPVARPTDEEAAARLFGAEPAMTEQGNAGRGAPEASSDAMGRTVGYQDAAPEADVPQGSEAAAAALETLAQRIRDGELPIPGYAPGMGDAAALAAALASLLGLRR